MAISLPAETLAAFDGDDLRARIFWEKYSLRGPDGVPTELTPDQMWNRIARELAAVEPDAAGRERWHREFRWLLSEFRMLPGGRIMHAVAPHEAGRKVVPINCFVLPLKDDSLTAIYDLCREMAITFSRGGGVGIDISRLRPRGAVVHNAAHIATGPVSFMETFSLLTETIGQAGRRGALMITMGDDHPDVLEFCRIKRDRIRVRHANISLLISDAFMRAVDAGDDWRLHYENPDAGISFQRTIPARQLWDELVRGARDWAEPGGLFVDNARRLGTTEYGAMHVLTTNPCGEQWLDPYNNCCLGSLNLLAFIRAPFAAMQPEDNVDWDALRRAVRGGTRLLDNVVTYADPLFPLEAQRQASRRTRRIGLGVTALGDMLAALGLRYDAAEAIAFAGQLMEAIKLEAYRTSIELAGERGPFPAFDADQHLGQEFFREFPEEMKERIRTVGLRNAAVMTVPPVGSGSALAGVTSGIEPIFALTYIRRSESLSQEQFQVAHPLVASYFRSRGEAPPGLNGLEDPEGFLHDCLPGWFVTAHQIDPVQRVKMQAAIARQVDNSVSSTINLPRDAPIETVERIYRLAWQMGCKGVTVYREGSREGILLTEQEVKAVRPPEQLSLTGAPESLLPRPERLAGPTYRIKTAFGTAFVTITELDDQPFEMFGRLGKGGTDAEAAAEAIGRMASTLLRLKGPVPRLERLSLIAEQLERIGGSRSVGFGEERVRSIPDAFAVAIRKYLADRLAGRPHSGGAAEEPAGADTELPGLVAPISSADLCPRCLQASLMTTGGCTTCASCGFKEC